MQQSVEEETERLETDRCPNGHHRLGTDTGTLSTTSLKKKRHFILNFSFFSDFWPRPREVGGPLERWHLVRTLI